LASLTVSFLYREVFKARDKKNPKKFVAMKKVLMDNEKEGVSFKIEICMKQFTARMGKLQGWRSMLQSDICIH